MELSMVKLRPWQTECVKKSLNWYHEKNKHFLVNAAPGAGKTIAACVVAQQLYENNTIDCVVLIAPRKAVIDQWTTDFRDITGRSMLKITSLDSEPEDYGTDYAATWSAVQGLLPAFQKICEDRKVLVICDEHHHAAIEASWGTGAFGAFEKAEHVLILTGTPVRSDGKESVWMACDALGHITHPDEGTYTISYGEAVDLGYCRPLTFHRHEGIFSVDLEDGSSTSITVSSKNNPELPGNLKKLSSLQKALDFYKLVCTRSLDSFGRPNVASYHGSMISWGVDKLDQIRDQMPQAGGLVIAPDIKFAEYMATLLEKIDGEKPFIVHSNVVNPEAKIDAFRKSNKRWIVSVGMISEGVDIPRLRILLYMPFARTELVFRQAMGRIVRNYKNGDTTRSYVVIPSHENFERFASNVENEMSPRARIEPPKSEDKLCPVCEAVNTKNTSTCSHCEHTFSDKTPQQKVCTNCDGLNPITAKSCISCGHSFELPFSVSLKEALRVGVIARGMDISEEEARFGEKISDDLRDKILKTGDQNLINIIRVIPEEAYGRLAAIINETLEN